MAASNDDDAIEAFDYGDDPEGEVDYGDDSEDVEFAGFARKEDDEFLPSYSQLEHVSRTGAISVRKAGSKMERALQAQAASAKELYKSKLNKDLELFFDNEGSREHYLAQLENIRRFWLKNSMTLAAAIYLYNKDPNKITDAHFKEVHQRSGKLPLADIYRYYRLLQYSAIKQ